MPPAKKTSSAQNTTLQSMGMDVIKQYPGPLTVSRAVKVDVPGNNWKYPCLRPTEKAIIARYMLKYAKGISAAPFSTSPDPSSSDAAASAAPSSGSARPPTHPPPTRSVAPTCRCSSAPVFSRTRHMMHE